MSKQIPQAPGAPTQGSFLVTDLPILTIPKPPFGSACNGCGLCCIREVCEIGIRITGQTKTPCPMLVSDGRRYYCGVVLVEETSELRHDPKVARALGIGMGCDADDDAIAFAEGRS